MTKRADVSGKKRPRWNGGSAKWPWRKYLTDAERKTLRKADRAKKAWEALNQSRALITNRAIHRAIYAARESS